MRIFLLLNYFQLLRIKEIRQKKGVTQKELASKTGIALRTIGDYENNKADITVLKLKSVASALDCNFWDLLEISGGITSTSIDTRALESQLSSSLESLPLELQVAILQAHLVESHKTIAALQNKKIAKLTQDFSNLEEYVYENISNLFGKKQADEYRNMLIKRKQEQSGIESENEKAG